MNILVTGGAGYIGSHFAKAAKGIGLKPVVLDNLSTGHERFVKYGPFVHLDLRDTLQVEKCLREYEIQAVVHFAGKSLVGESMSRPDHYYSNNVGGTLSLLRAMKDCNIRTLVFSSSCAVYGLAKTDTISENHALEPINPYGRSKLICEQMIRDFEMAYGFRYALLRYFNVIGEDPAGELWEDHTPETHLVPSLVNALKTAQPFQMFGTDFGTPDGTAIRDYVDVNDLALVHLKALQYLNQNKRVVSNIGAGQGQSVKQVFDTVAKVFGKEPVIEKKPPRLGDPPKLVADAHHFRSWCDVKLRPFEETLKAMRANLERGRA